MLKTVMIDLKLKGSSGQALRQCIAAVRREGTVSVPGVYAGLIHGFLATISTRYDFHQVTK